MGLFRRENQRGEGEGSGQPRAGGGRRPAAGQPEILNPIFSPPGQIYDACCNLSTPEWLLLPVDRMKDAAWAEIKKGAYGLKHPYNPDAYPPREERPAIFDPWGPLCPVTSNLGMLQRLELADIRQQAAANHYERIANGLDAFTVFSRQSAEPIPIRAADDWGRSQVRAQISPQIADLVGNIKDVARAEMRRYLDNEGNPDVQVRWGGTIIDESDGGGQFPHGEHDWIPTVLLSFTLSRFGKGISVPVVLAGESADELAGGFGRLRDQLDLCAQLMVVTHHFHGYGPYFQYPTLYDALYGFAGRYFTAGVADALQYPPSLTRALKLAGTTLAMEGVARMYQDRSGNEWRGAVYFPPSSIFFISSERDN